MKYDSPKQIRNRQQAAEKTRRARQAKPINVMTDEQWESFCNFHLSNLHRRANEECADAAGRHARALVTMAVQRRATELMRTFALISVWKAMDVARHELLNVEV